MNKDDRSNETEIRPERHHVKRAVSSHTARFDVQAASENEPAVVTTRLVRGHGCGRDAAWQVEVSVEHPVTTVAARIP
jgi:hypothetical protein